jgi:hypothetical protein
MKLTKIAVSMILALGSVAAAGTVWGDTVIPVQNSNFSDTTYSLNNSCGTGCAYNYGPIAGWTMTGGQSGTQVLNSNYYTTPAPGGGYMAYSNGSTLSQDLGVTANPDSLYTLSVWVGNRLDNPGTDFTISLDAGSTVLATMTAPTGSITPGTWQDEILTYTSGDVAPTGDLTIVLESDGVQTDFADVQLTDPYVGQVQATPEPSSFLMLGMGLLGLMGMAVAGRKTGLAS